MEEQDYTRPANPWGVAGSALTPEERAKRSKEGGRAQKDLMAKPWNSTALPRGPSKSGRGRKQFYEALKNAAAKLYGPKSKYAEPDELAAKSFLYVLARPDHRHWSWAAGEYFNRRFGKPKERIDLGIKQIEEGVILVDSRRGAPMPLPEAPTAPRLTKGAVVRSERVLEEATQSSEEGEKAQERAVQSEKDLPDGS